MQIDFKVEYENFYEGMSPVAHIDGDTFIGNSGQASDMLADVISKPGFITQSPGLSDLTNGTQAGVVDQLIRFILDEPTNADETYAVGTTKLFKLSATAVVSGGSPSWPQTITSMAEGESVIRLKENLFVLYNTASAGDIAAMPLSTEVIDPDWGSSTDQALELAPHPSAAKEDILLFGNGQYVGAYIQGTATLDVQKLDFGQGKEVVDIVFSANNWYIAVNSGEGKRSQIYLYDGGALSNLLSDETAVGNQKIGFLYVLNGIIFVAYQDLSSDGYSIGWISGRVIKPLRYFLGTLPNHRQKALYKNTVLMLSGDDVWTIGASVEQLPIQISRLSDAGYANVGAIASPFGTPMAASSDGGSNHRLAKFSGYSTDSQWTSVFSEIGKLNMLGMVDTMIVYTKPLGVDARCDVTLEGDQGQLESTAYEVSGENETRHVFNSIDLKACADVRVNVSFENGNTTNDCPVRKIVLLGHWVEV